jgi:hypothetical protein
MLDAPSQSWSSLMRPEFSKTLKMYALTGIVTAVKPELRKIVVHNTHIRGLLKPTERDYTLKDDKAFSNVNEGDFVHATLLTDNEEVWVLDQATFVHKRIKRSA